jgi:hypothetical protein
MLPRVTGALLAPALCLAAAPSFGQTTVTPSVAELARLVEHQRQALERQERLIEELRRRLDEVSRAAGAPSEASAVEERLARVEASVQQIPDMPADVVAAGDFPGSIQVPGTDVAIKIAGLVRVTAVNTFGPLGTEDRFVTSSIPVAGTPEAGKEPRFVLGGAPSRFNLDVRSPTGVGAMRAFIEGDFAGDGRTFRLRHAYGQWKGFVIGQTWSTFADPEAEPDGIDFEGLNAIALFRQPLLRYSHRLGERFSLAAALENPAPDITNAAGVSQVPDLVLRVGWRPVEGQGFLRQKLFRQDTHVNLALLFRQIRGEPIDQPNVTLSTGGFGVGLSGRLTAPWQPERGQITFSAYAGSGIGRYVTDLGSLGGQDAYYDAGTNDIEALPVFAWYLGFERRWSSSFRSTFTYGTVVVDNLDVQPADTLHATNRGSFNLTWSPIQRLDLVAEFLFGNRINKDRRRGSSSQLQLGTNFRF